MAEQSEFEKFWTTFKLKVTDSTHDIMKEAFAAGERSFKERVAKVLLEHRKSFRNENSRNLVAEAIRALETGK